MLSTAATLASHPGARSSRGRAPSGAPSTHAARRKAPRITLHILAEVRTGGRHQLGWLLDLSARGLFIRTGAPVPVGARATLEFCLPDTGEIVRCIGLATSSVAAGGLGPGGNRFDFVVMRPAHRDRVAAFIARALAARLRRGRSVGDVEISLLADGALLDDLAILPPGDVEATGVDALPDVGLYLEDLSGDAPFEPINDVGTVSPDDMEQVA